MTSCSQMVDPYSWACRVNFTTQDEWGYNQSEGMVCDDFYTRFQEVNDTNGTNNTGNDTYDPRNDTNWSCYEGSCYFNGMIEGCVQTSCSEN